MSQEISQNFLEAVAAAYTWICCSDGEVPELEIEGFTKTLLESNLINSISATDFEKAFLNLMEIFHRNYEEGVETARERILKIKNDSYISEQVLFYARKAIVADHKIEPREEVVISEIKGLLDIKESA